MKNKETAGKIYNNLKTKYRCLNQVYDFTKELDNALESEDEESVLMILEMRGKQLEICMDMDRQNRLLAESLDDEEKYHVNMLLKPEENTPEPKDSEEEEIYSMVKRIRNLLIKTVNYDTNISSRLNK